MDKKNAARGKKTFKVIQFFLAFIFLKCLKPHSHNASILRSQGMDNTSMETQLLTKIKALTDTIQHVKPA